MFAHPFPFDPTYGYDLAQLQRVRGPDEPADFAAFWRGTFAEAAAVAPQSVCRPIPAATAGFESWEIEFSAWGGMRLKGWLSKPKGPVRRGLVVGHGYGGRDGPDVLPWLGDAAIIYPAARGLFTNRISGVSPLPEEHVLAGIGSRETYIHRGCAADIWAAAAALLEQVPEASERLDYVGASYGGGIGALALPWDRRFSSAALIVPSFGQHPLRLTMPCVGSGQGLQRIAKDRPEILSVLRYFDASTAARHLTTPTFVAAAVFDPMVPPPGQFAVYNELPGPKELRVLPAAHFPYAEEAQTEAALSAAVRAFLGASPSGPERAFA